MEKNGRYKMEKERMYSLDILKCLATIAILFHHFQQIFSVSFQHGINYFGGTYYWGNMVELFFLVSGFVSYHYVEKIYSKEISAFDFWFSRYVRFAPLLIPTMIICGIAEFLLFKKLDYPFAYGIYEFVLGMLGLQMWVAEGSMLNNPVWYLSVLLYLYVIFFFLCKIAKKKETKVENVFGIAFVFFVIMNYITNVYGISFPGFTYCISRGGVNYFLGLLLFSVVENNSWIRKKGFAIICLIYVIIYIYIFRGWHEFITGEWYIQCFTVFPAILIFFTSEFMCAIFKNIIWRGVGKWSYHAYMWHAPIYMFVLLYVKLNSDNIFIDSRWHMYIMVLGVFCFSVISILVIEPLNVKMGKMIRKVIANY